ncbi:coat protein [ssRNA phage SRR6960507_12]|uniref:Coat protein n=1 Tax=ssRNA phage SRR6960507_12 TaxID=2786510 RepID=A0A8S5L4J2_9VIRU|nr:coat protein [ssRNA phage SRR6960507_12]DAD52253.1 TPA_asm: coat protein [ssRNA phage SRR6960507_12]
MTIPNPLVVTVNGAAKNLPRINQDSYGSEYYLEETSQSFRVKIRHSKETPRKDGVQYDRHNVELTQTIFAVGAVPEYSFTTYVVIRHDKNVSTSFLGYLQVALNGLMLAPFVTDLKGWQN